MHIAVEFMSPLRQMTRTTQTCLWNDSASIQELTYSISHGAVGGLSQPDALERADWGGDVIISPRCKWQMRYNASDVPVVPRIEKAVNPVIVDNLLGKFSDFRRAYNEDGMTS